MTTTDDVKFRIEQAETELKLAKIELKRLTPVEDIGAFKVKAYLDSIGCTHTIRKVTNTRTVFMIKSGLQFGIKTVVSKLPYGYNASVTYTKFTDRLELSVFKDLC